MACIDYKGLDVGRRYRRVIDIEGGQTGEDEHGVNTTAFVYHVSLSCCHCENPACMHVCPTGAMHKNALGLVEVDVRRCIGCGYCTIACPYHAPSIDPELKRSSKCDGCAERVGAGKRPICVEACPLRALEFGDIAELQALHPGTTQHVLPLPEAGYTNPSLLILASPAAERALVEGARVANEAEIANNAAE